MRNGFGVTRWVVKVEHALFLADFMILIGALIAFFGGLIQAGYSDVATAITQDFLQLMGPIPWWVGLLFVGFGIILTMTTGGKGE